MRYRPLETKNRILRQVAGDDLSVGLGTSVGAMYDMPTLGPLVRDKLERNAADIRARQQVYLDLDAVIRDEQQQIQDQLETETNPDTLAALRKRGVELQSLMASPKIDRYQQRLLDLGAYKTPEELTEAYGDLLTFDRSMSEEEAKLLYDNAREEAVRNFIVDAGPKGFLPGVAKFAGGMAAMATDPLEVATMFIPITSLAGRTKTISRFGKVRGNALIGAREGGVGAAITEPFYYTLSQDAQIDYTMMDALFNVGAGLFLGGGIGSARGALQVRAARAAEKVKKANYEDLLSERTTDLERKQRDDAWIPDLESVPLREINNSVNKTRKMHKVIGDHVTFDMAIRQFVNDQNITVDLIAPKRVGRPETLSSFVKSKGGVNDADPSFRGELANIGIPPGKGHTKKNGVVVNYINNQVSDLNLDDMAELAYEAGYLTSRDTNELVARLSDEVNRDKFTFSAADQFEAELWRAYHEGKSDFEAEVEFRNEIREELQMMNRADVSDDEIAAIADRMSRTGETVQEAAMEVSIKVEDVRAAMLARAAADVDNLPNIDVEASERAAEVPDEFDIEGNSQRESDIVAQARASGDLTERQIAELDAIDKLDEMHEARLEVIRAGVQCVVRT